MMKSHTVAILAATALLVSEGALAAESTTSPATTPATSASHTATGVVKQVDAAGGKVVIAHDAVKSLAWPAMTMGFTVKDKALYNKLAVGKTVEFQLTKEGNNYVVTAVK